MKYSIKKQIELSFEEALENLKKNLADEGFGILTQINVKETLKKKLDVDFDKYMILGACNPPFAYKSLKLEHEIGLLLPCNVIVYEKNKKVYVSAINPVVAMGFINNKELSVIAKKIQIKLEKIINKLN